MVLMPTEEDGGVAYVGKLENLRCLNDACEEGDFSGSLCSVGLTVDEKFDASCWWRKLPAYF